MFTVNDDIQSQSQDQVDLETGHFTTDFASQESNLDFMFTPRVESAEVPPRKPKHGYPIYDLMDGVQPLGLGFTSQDSDLQTPLAVPARISTSEQRSSGYRAEFERATSHETASESVPHSSTDRVACYGKDLSGEQRAILHAVAEGTNIFFTGAAGTGKSVTLRAIIRMMNDKYGPMNHRALAVTASTGIAALNIGGQTLHCFACVGLAKKPIPELIDQLRFNRTAKANWRKVKTIIIDEISMVDAIFFDKLETIARVIRHTNKPFGGIQLIICGDFFQLPPVPDQYGGAQVSTTFAFNARSWHRCIQRHMRLTQVFRQADPVFVNLLNRMRIGRVDKDMVETIQKLNRDIDHNGIQPVQIYPLTAQVASANARQLDALSGSVFSNTAQDRGRWLDHENHNEKRAHDLRISNLLDKYSIAPRNVILKEGAQVMLIRNLVQGELVNGSLGRVVSFATCHEARKQGILSATSILEEALEDQRKSNGSSIEQLRRLQEHSTENDGIWPIVEFTSTRKVFFSPIPFDTEDVFGDLEATRVQIPLVLAWAITIHKSQGQSIEKLKIDFNGTFEAGQAYVAMSRATGLSSLQVVNFNSTIVRAHPHVISWYSNLLLEEEMDNEDAITVYNWQD